jgi:WD40 repeat protein
VIRIVDVHGREQSLREQEGAVNSVVFAPDGRLASGGFDQSVRLRSLQASANEGQRREPGLRALCVALSPDGKHLAAGTWDGTVYLRETAHSHQWMPLRGHTARVRSLAFSSDGRSLASGSADKSIRVWNVTTRQELRCLIGHRGTVWGLAFTPDGRLVSGARDHTIRLWEPDSGKELVCQGGLCSPVLCVALDSTGRWAAGTENGTVGIWEAQRSTWRTWKNSDAGVSVLAFSRNGHRLAGRCLDQKSRLWDADRGACLEEIDGAVEVVALANGSREAPWLAIARKGETVIAASATRKAVAWYPAAVQRLTSDDSGQLWAGTQGDHVCLLCLEAR